MDEDAPLRRSPDKDSGAAGLLAGENLERYSLGELDQRLTLLEAEIVRVSSHRQRSAAHRSAADAIFGARR